MGGVEVISTERRIEGSQTAFHPKVLDAFRQNHLLFVYSNGEFSGVVHFSDFNKSAVSTYLFQVLFQYERTLRIFLQECGFGNLDIVNYFKDKVAHTKKDSSKDYYQRKIDGYFKHQDKNEKLPPFQSFYLDDLISFANSMGNNLKVDVIELRYMVMHAHEIVNMQDRSLDNYIFDFASFEKFYRQALALHDDHKKVKNKVAFLQGLDETVRFQ